MRLILLFLFLQICFLKIYAQTAVNPGVEGELQLFKAINNGDRKSVDSLLTAHVSANAVYFEQITALGFAALKGDTSIIVSLLDKGALINESGPMMSIPAIAYAIMSRQQPAFELLLRKGASVKPAMKNLFGQTSNYYPLVKAVAVNNYKAVETLLGYGVAIDSLSTGAESYALMGRNALMIASEKGYRPIADLLISKGANVNVLGRGWSGTSSSVLMNAAVSGDTAVVGQLIRKGANVNTVDSEGKNALLMAASRSHVNVVDQLLNAGADLNVADQQGNNALLSSVIYHRNAVMQAVSGLVSNFDRFLQFEGTLFQSKFNWKPKDTLLAVTNMDLSEIERSIARVVYPESIEHKDFKDVSYSLMKEYELNNRLLASYLVNKGIPVNLKNKLNKTAADMMLEFKLFDALELLINAGANDPGVPVAFFINTALKSKNNARLGNYLPLYAGKLSDQDKQAATILAVIAKNEAAADLLASHGIRPDVKSGAGFSPLHFAAYAGDQSMITKLLTLGADKNKRNAGLVQPYHIARFTGNTALMNLLLPDSLTKPKEMAIAAAVAQIEHDVLLSEDPLKVFQLINNDDNYYLTSVGKRLLIEDPLLNRLQSKHVTPYKNQYIQALLAQNFLVINPDNNSIETFQANQAYATFKPFSFETKVNYKNGSNSGQQITSSSPIFITASEQKESSHDAATSITVQMAGMVMENFPIEPNTYYLLSGAYAGACGGWKNNCAVSVGGKCIEWKSPKSREGKAGYQIKGRYEIPGISLKNNKFNVAFPGVIIKNYPKSVLLKVKQGGQERSVVEGESVEMDRQLGDIEVVVQWADEVKASGSGCQKRQKESLISITYQHPGDIELTTKGTAFEDRLKTYKRIYSIKQMHDKEFGKHTAIENYSLLSNVHLLSELAKRKYKDVIKTELIGVVEFLENTNFKSLNDALIQLSEVSNLQKPDLIQMVDNAVIAADHNADLIGNLMNLRQGIEEMPLNAIQQKIKAYKSSYMTYAEQKISDYNKLLLEYSLYIPEQTLVQQLALERIPLYRNYFSSSANELFN